MNKFEFNPITGDFDLVGEYQKTIEDIDSRRAGGYISLSSDKFYRITLSGDLTVYMERHPDNILRSYDLAIITNSIVRTIAFPEEIIWIKDLQLRTNCRYDIVIEDNVAVWSEIPLT